MTIPSTLSVIVPTVNPDRPLARCLETIQKQPLHEGDEVIVVGDTTDGPLPTVEATVKEFGPQFRYLSLTGEHHDFGHSQINYAMSQARAGWLTFQDDDDVYTVGAFNAIRATIAELKEPRPMLFRFLTHYAFMVWDKPILQLSHISGHCAVFPNIPERLGRWGPTYEGDFTFIRDTLALWPEGSALWNKAVISVGRPERLPDWV